MSTTESRSRILPRLRSARAGGAAVAVLLALLLAVAACSSGGDSDAGDASFADAEGAVEEAPNAYDEARDGVSLTEGGRAADGVAHAPGETQQPVEEAIIFKGNVSVSSKDVEKTAFDVQEIADEYGGEVTDRRTSTDEEGEVRLARMVLRVPAEDFDEAFAELEQVADLEASSASSEDVTTQMIDNQVRIRAQRRSLQRVEVLLDRAQTIRDIVAIEAQLTRRQAALDSLEQQQAYLRDKTTMSTITVNIERTEDRKERETDDAGFLTGLSKGWDALGTFGTWVATAVGALLPFAVVFLVLGAPAWLLVRRTLRRRSAPSTP